MHPAKDAIFDLKVTNVRKAEKIDNYHNSFLSLISSYTFWRVIRIVGAKLKPKLTDVKSDILKLFIYKV